MSLFASEEEKRAFLEIKDDDDPTIKAMKTELLMVIDMTPHEKQVFYAEQRVQEEERHLQWMIDSNKRDDEFIAYAKSRAKKEAFNIEQFGAEPVWVEALEQWVEIIKGTQRNKFTIADIRKQREIIWAVKRKLNQIKTSTSDEPSKS